MKILSTLLLLPGLALAQNEAVGSPVRGENVGNYNFVQSWELGYRFADIYGNRGKYRSDVNYRNGFRLLGSSLTVNSRDGHGRWFDELVLTTQGLGNDPYESTTIRLQKNKLYRYDLLWRQNDYFNPGLTVASGLHLEDTTHRWQDHDLTLLPQNWFRFRLGYSRVKENGPALSTEQEITSRDPVFPLFRDVRRQFDDYRLGGDIQFRRFRFTLQRRWEFYKEDTADNGPGAFVPNPFPGGGTLQSFNRAQPYRGFTPSWLGNLYAESSLIAINARVTYNSGRGDFVQSESATGVSTSGNFRQQILVFGNATRPVLSGDFNFTLFPSARFSLINNTSISNIRIVGNNSYTQFDLGTFSFDALNFQLLNIRLLTNATDLRARFTKTFDAFAGFRYSDRLIRSVEDQTSSGFPFSASPVEQINLTRAGIAGLNWLPIRNLRAHVEAELGRNDGPFTPVSLRDYHAIRARVQYRARAVTAGFSFQENNNQNSTSFSSFSSRARSYSTDFSWAARRWVSVDTSWSKLHLDSIGGIAYFTGVPRPVLVSNQKSINTSNIHAVSIGLRFALMNRADLFTGYSLTRDTGDGRSTTTTDAFYNAQAFPLTFQSPSARFSLRLHEKLRFNVGYQYYGYKEKFGQLFQRQNYRANTGYTSLLWSF